MARLRKCFDDCRSAVRRRVSIHQLAADRNLPFARNRIAGGFNCANYFVAPFKIRVAYVNAEADSARNAVDRAGEHIADAYGCHRVDRSTGTRGILNCQNQLGRRAESVFAVGHQNPASVSAGTLDQNSKTCRRGDFRDNAQRSLLALQQWPLLNVQFDECLVVATGQAHLFKFSGETRRTANLIQRDAVIVCQFSCRICGKSSRQQPASEATDSKTSWFFRSEYEQLNRMLWMKSTLLQRAYRFQAS